MLHNHNALVQQERAKNRRKFASARGQTNVNGGCRGEGGGLQTDVIAHKAATVPRSEISYVSTGTTDHVVVVIHDGHAAQCRAEEVEVKWFDRKRMRLVLLFGAGGV